MLEAHRLLPAKDQIDAILSVVPDLEDAVPAAHARIEELAAMTLPAFDGVLIIPDPRMYRSMTNHVAMASWESMARWGIECDLQHLDGSVANYRHTHYERTLATKTVLKGLYRGEDPDDGKAALLGFPVRWSTVGERILAPCEFELPLSATVWYLTSHWSILHAVPHHLVACVGERYHPSTAYSATGFPMVFGYDDGRRIAKEADDDYIKDFPTLIGYVPELASE